MGVQDLSKLLTKFRLRSSLKLEDAAGLRVAVDIYCYLYKYVRSRLDWASALAAMLHTLCDAGIRPILVFDGPDQPVEKQKEQQLRKVERDKNISKLAALRLMESEDDAVRERLKELFPKSVQPAQGQDVTGYVLDKIAMLELRTRCIDQSIVDMTRKIAGALGIPCTVAAGEAETLCVDMIYSGLADAVMTEDTDVLAYTFGADWMSDNNLIILSHPTDTHIDIVDKQLVLDALSFNQLQFRDACILLGCDYNERIKGYGPSKVVPLIRDHGCIEQLSLTEEQLQSTLYVRCREIFTARKTRVVLPETSTGVDKEALSQLLLQQTVCCDAD